ncbi:MAG: hypothetical protein QS721_08325 [Candidatus Endonucleobacter sp. (ex Gigantidas childressi)]|nr:hypothetical protein [Candidatus Endonucleobacter sp. (ex Gigantidas childressi)]
MLTALTHPNHLLLLGSWGLCAFVAYPRFNGNGYKTCFKMNILVTIEG